MSGLDLCRKLRNAAVFFLKAVKEQDYFYILGELKVKQKFR